MTEKDYRLFMSDRHVATSTRESYHKVMDSYINPSIIEERKMNVAQMDVFTRLFMERILFLGTEINADVANIVTSQLLFLEMDNPEKPITMYINSPGGSVYDGMAIYDTMHLISCPVVTTCIGECASMAAVLLAGGEKGQRLSLPNSQIMIHQPIGGTGRAQAADVKIAAAEIEKCENMLYSHLAEDSGKTFDEIKKACDRDHYLTPKEAIEFGLIDSIITKR